MKRYIKYIPLTVFAAAILLGGSLSAQQTAREGTNIRDRQSQSHNQGEHQTRSADRTQTRTTERSASMSRSDQDYSSPIAASDILGMNIDSDANDKIGEIDEIYVDSSTGEVLAMVVSTGGFLGIGQDHTLISPQDLRFNDDRSALYTDISKEQIRNAPKYQKGETAGLHQVRPLGKSAADREDRTARMSRTEGRQNASQRRTTGDRDDRTDRMTRTTRDESSDRTSQQAGQQQAGQQSEEGRGLAVSDLIGMDVENRQGESVGKVNEVFLDLEKGEVVGVVVSTGGFLRMGDRKTLFGMQEMSLDPRNEKVVLDYNRNQIRGFPEYKEDDQSVFEELRERVARLDPRRTSRPTAERE